MSDIVEELCSAADTGHDGTGYVMKKAAEEIERLRARLDNYVETIGLENIQLETENECMRAAVEAIEMCTRYPVSNAVLAHVIAVKALQPKKGEK